jgi:hypothetical protein
MADLRALRAAVAVAMIADSDEAAAAVCRVCTAALPVQGAAFTAMASDQARELLYASDLVIEQVQSLQFSLGEGPALDAFRTGRPTCIPDLAVVEVARWPILTRALAELPIGGLFAFPVGVGAITIGVLDVYRSAPGWLSREDLATVLTVLDLAAAALLALRTRLPSGAQVDGGGGGSPGGAWLDGVGSDRRVHQATGMLIAQLGIGAEAAFARLRGHAFATDQRIGAVAEEIVARRLRLDLQPD